MVSSLCSRSLSCVCVGNSLHWGVTKCHVCLCACMLHACTYVASSPSSLLVAIYYIYSTCKRVCRFLKANTTLYTEGRVWKWGYIEHTACTYACVSPLQKPDEEIRLLSEQHSMYWPTVIGRFEPLSFAIDRRCNQFLLSPVLGVWMRITCSGLSRPLFTMPSPSSLTTTPGWHSRLKYTMVWMSLLRWGACYEVWYSGTSYKGHCIKDTSL